MACKLMNKKSDVPTKEGDSISKDDVLDQNPIDDTKESGLEEASLLNGEEQERSLSPEEELKPILRMFVNVLQEIGRRLSTTDTKV
jgi:hypothetical protein